MPFFLLKNYLGAKMKKGMRTFCNNDGSTSTLNQQNSTNTIGNNNIHSQVDTTSKLSSPTLEDLILQLEMEEEMARKAKLNEYSGIRGGRMSCVNNSDILRSARNAALNQYPRFSLDGRDSMYRSSFGTTIEGRRSVCSERSLGERLLEENDDDNNNKVVSFPPTLAGQSVVWCKPGIVAKLMGLEAIPVPVCSKRSEKKEKLVSSVVRNKQNIIRRRFERHHDLEKRLAMDMKCYHEDILRRNRFGGCSSKNGYCIMKPVSLEAMAGGPANWMPRRSYV